jgi:hypothetical protein
MGNRKRYDDDDDMYGSRYGMRRGGRRYWSWLESLLIITTIDLLEW